MEQHQNRHNLTQAQLAGTLALHRAADQQVPLPDRQKNLAEIIDIAEQLN